MNTFSNFDAAIQTFYLPGQARFYCFRSYITIWLPLQRHGLNYRVFFSLQFGNKPLSLLPRKAECSFFEITCFFFVLIFVFVFCFFFFLLGGGGFEIQDTLLRIPRVLLIGKLWDYSCLQKCWCLQPLIFTYDNWIRFNQPINFSCSHSPFFMSDYLQLSSLRLLYGNEVTYYLCSC